MNNPKYADDKILMAETEEERKSLLIKVKEESKRAGLKLNIQESKIMAYSPITSVANRWGNNGNSDKLYFGGAPKSVQMVTSAMKLKGVCSLEE